MRITNKPSGQSYDEEGNKLATEQEKAKAKEEKKELFRSFFLGYNGTKHLGCS